MLGCRLLRRRMSASTISRGMRLSLRSLSSGVEDEHLLHLKTEVSAASKKFLRNVESDKFRAPASLDSVVFFHTMHSVTKGEKSDR